MCSGTKMRHYYCWYQKMVFPDSKKRHRMLEQMALCDFSDLIFLPFNASNARDVSFLPPVKQCCVS